MKLPIPSIDSACPESGSRLSSPKTLSIWLWLFIWLLSCRVLVEIKSRFVSSASATIAVGLADILVLAGTIVPLWYFFDRTPLATIFSVGKRAWTQKALVVIVVLFVAAFLFHFHYGSWIAAKFGRNIRADLPLDVIRGLRSGEATTYIAVAIRYAPFVLLVPLIEEYLYRFIIYNRLAAQYSLRSAQVLTCAIFVLSHLVGIVSFKNILAAWNPGQLTLGAVILLALRVKSGSLLPGMTFHVLNNGLLTFLMLQPYLRK